MSDELAEIDGLKPKVVMVDGDEKEVSSMSRCVWFTLVLRSPRSVALGLRGFLGAMRWQADVVVPIQCSRRGGAVVIRLLFERALTLV